MTSLESIFAQNALSVLPTPLIQEWTDQLRNLDWKLREEIEQLKEEKTQLDAKVKALIEENEKNLKQS
ncbi:Protein of unknown function [Pyronema omphalodes CBS 100304]|uniref:Uncharacterized protein n=1 Tax=Pyronema omphalodes (strain CBS 100304) TaxID=1076935 RepID=U4L6E6_PYROM|nr:Protein of unknown function [Pyronema omphalodes CBS 100304]